MQALGSRRAGGDTSGRGGFTTRLLLEVKLLRKRGKRRVPYIRSPPRHRPSLLVGATTEEY